MAPTPSGPSFRSQIVPLFAARLVELGLDAQGLLRRFGLSVDVAAERDVEVPLSVV